MRTTIFDLELFDLPSLVRHDGDIRRYETPEGNYYPSVTTVLGATGDKSFLERWKQRVGEEEAERIKVRSAIRGSAMHNMLEKFVLNETVDLRKEMPFNVNLFKQIKVLLEEHVDTVYSSEGQLYSDRLKLAGSVDLIANWKGEPAIIDFKTSLKQKKVEWIHGYFMQVTLYALMWYERTGRFFRKGVILIACESESVAQVFEFDIVPYIEEALEVNKSYYLLTSKT